MRLMSKNIDRILTFILLLAISLIACSSIHIDMNENAFTSINAFFTQSDNLWDNLRDEFKLEDQSDHPRVQAQIAWLLRSPERFEKMVAQAEPYLYYICHEIKKRHLPAELALMPMIESAYDPFAYSGAGAAGLWQIMPGTGTGFGLKQNWWYDGRRDVYDSTHAALDYLQYLHKFFDSNWLHAIAAYDSGEGTVNHAVLRNRRRHQATDIWSLSLPKETTNYVPRLFAVVEIIKHPKKYHIKLPKVVNQPYFDRVKLDFQVKFKDVANATSLDLTEIYRLNPGYNRWATDPDGPYHIVLPVDKIAAFKANIRDLPHQEYQSLKRYKIRKGDSLSIVAKRFNTTVALLKAVNKLSSNRIRLNQMLILPEGSLDGSEDITRSVITPKISRLGPRKIIYHFKRYDTLARVARRFHTKVSSLQFWNQLDANSKIKPGTRLIIWKKTRRRRHRHIVHYRIRRGDALLKIAHRYHVSVRQLKRWNPSIRGSRYIKPGHYIEIFTA